MFQEEAVTQEVVDDFFDAIFSDEQYVQEQCDFSSKYPETLNEYICSEAFMDRINTPVDISKGELFLMLLKFSLKNCLSISAMTEIFKITNLIFAEPILPNSKYVLDKYLNPQDDIQFHAVCHNCCAYIGTFEKVAKIKECNTCKEQLDLSNPSNTSFFIIINPSQQISDLIHINENHYNYVVNDRVHEEGQINDIYDGKAYRDFVASLPLQERNHYVTTSFNTDGAPKFKCSKYSIWPIYLMVNELPIQSRMKNLITCGLWFHKKKPDMNVFLNPFVDIINKLSEEGIPCNIIEQERFLKIYLLNCVVDSVARAPIQGIKQFNGSYGCNWCLHPGVWSDGSMRYPVQDSIPKQRSSEATLNDMFTATPTNSIFGVKGPSPFINIPEFDIISGFVPDYLHCCLEGVGNRITEKLINDNLDAEDINKMDSILNKIAVPNQISRLTRPLSVRSDWKAREWENYILYYSIPVLSLVLNSTFLNYWGLFVESLYILLQEKITIDELDKANELLHRFVIETQRRFGITEMTFNMHQLLHLCKSVYEWGPLWAQSTFPFESGNYILLKAIKSAKGVTQQISRFIHINHSVLILQEHVYKNDCNIAKLYCEDIMNGKVKETCKITNITYFGKGDMVNDDMIDSLNLIDEAQYSRMVKDGCLYKSSKRKNYRSNDSFVQLKDGRFVKLINFIVDENRKVEITICQLIVTSKNAVKYHPKLRLIDRIEENIITVPTHDISNICIYMKIDGKRSYICPVVNLIHY